MHLIQIFLPLEDNQGNRFPVAKFDVIKVSLTEKFGGMTAYMQSAATGLWEKSDSSIVHDKIAVFEVMAEEFNKSWWKIFQEAQQKEFAQDLIVIRAFQIEIL